jgi:hypothetical protein
MPPSYDKLASASAIYAYAGNDPVNSSDRNGHQSAEMFGLPSPVCIGCDEQPFAPGEYQRTLEGAAKIEAAFGAGVAIALAPEAGLAIGARYPVMTSMATGIAAGEVGLSVPTLGSTLVVGGVVVARAQDHHIILERLGDTALGRALSQAGLFRVNAASNLMTAWQNGGSQGHRDYSASVEAAWRTIERLWQRGAISLSEAQKRVKELQAANRATIQNNPWTLAATRANSTSPARTGPTGSSSSGGGSGATGGGLIGRFLTWLRS